MTLAQRFTAALAAESGDSDAGPGTGGDQGHLLPDRLARVTARLLETDGAGISMLAGPLGWAPIGASSTDAARAERLQFTVGSGPCMVARETGRPVFVVAEDVERRWPAFGDLLLSSTPFRGVISLPLQSPVTGAGAMDLFFQHPGDVPNLDVFDALAVGDLVGSALGDATVWSSWSEEEGPDWLRSPPALRRAAVWQAVGRINIALDVDAPRALALLRAHAWSAGRSVDSVAADLLSGRLMAADVLGRPGPP